MGTGGYFNNYWDEPHLVKHQLHLLVAQVFALLYSRLAIVPV